VLPLATRAAALERLCRGADFVAVPDLCALAARTDSLLRTLAGGGAVTILACHPRAVRALFTAAGAPLSAAAQIVDLRVPLGETALANVTIGSAAPRDPAQLAADLDGQAVESSAWFPVIDFARCTHCQQCLSFCLFGVYAMGTDGQLQVRQPDNCKPACPACARVCPELAIIFPKHGAAPINGAEIRDADQERGPAKVDISALLGGDVYQSLRERRAQAPTRFDVGRNAELAAAERRKCLAELQQQLDIPPEVLQSLSTADAILDRMKKKAGRVDEKTS
jgi:NAD-dependent dihydropyrimidine dehydrogenase PreA subunit